GGNPSYAKKVKLEITNLVETLETEEIAYRVKKN
ncbi:bifunctional precorrin-2 dehydrogenase/sirohydrochlorin ferrochelatase, partial [Listeria ivanovii]